MVETEDKPCGGHRFRMPEVKLLIEFEQYL